jgi:endoglucanase
MRLTKLLLIAGLFPLVALGQNLTSNIRVNQVGYYTSANKQAVVKGSSGTSFSVINASTQANVLSGTLSATKQWVYSNENVAIADFSSVTEAGDYYIVVSDLGKSYTFPVSDNAYADIARGSTKAYYYQRASTDLPEQYAGIWHRNMGHPDNKVIIHASAATTLIPKNTLINVSKGWYDAADYNKYIVNAGISTFTFLHLYETMPYYFTNLDLNIPESGNNIPDILDEVLWNLDWMLSMQDPNDGGVYFKCTNVTMDGWDMPEDATLARYVVQKSTTSALDFAAIMAQSARVFADFESELPGFSAKCLTAARSAYDWALANDNITYNESAMNSKYNPDIETGEYPDDYYKDEFSWAAAELFITTGETKYKSNIDIISGEWNDIDIPSWQKVKTLGLLSLITNKDKLSTADYNTYESELLTLATSLKNAQSSSAYKTSLGMADWEFTWGSNAIAANQSMLLLDAHRIDDTKGYLDAAMGNMDYLLGRNPLNFSYVSGFGTDYPRNIHHRQSGSDGINEPVPGFLVGGPNQWASDGVNYPSSLPAMQYADVNVSWATNEVTINWNAPLMYCTHTINSMLSGVTPPPQPENTAPAITIDPNVTIILPQDSQTVHASATDLDGEVVAVLWTQESGSSVNMVGASTNSLSLSALMQGTCRFRFTATDNEGATAYREVEVTVTVSLPTTSMKIEAEDADILTGVNVANSMPNYSGTGYVSGFDQTTDKITFKVVLLKAGNYPLTIQYFVEDGEMQNDLFVNDNYAARLIMPNTGDWAGLRVENISLNAGTNTIEVRAHWGWFNLDYIQIGSVDPVNIPPVVVVSASTIIRLPEASITLSGSATDDESIASVEWTQESGPTANLDNINTNMLYASNLIVGEYTFRFTATDNLAVTGFGDVNVSVLSAIAVSSHFEAEDAILTGVYVDNSQSGYSGAGYVDGFDAVGDNVKFTVNVSEAGDYPLTIKYFVENGEMQNDLFVNDNYAARLIMPNTNDWTGLSVENISLNAGNNTIEVRAHWGWFNLDYIEIEGLGETTKWNELSYEDFENGFGQYRDGGTDCMIYSGATFAHQGSNAINLQDNTNTSNATLSNTIDIETPGYQQLKIEFWYYCVSMDNSTEDFWLQYWDGTEWITLSDYAFNIEFLNNEFHNETIIISESDYNFPSDMKIRFVCDASGDKDDVYIDEIRISASTAAGTTIGLKNSIGLKGLENNEELLESNNIKISDQKDEVIIFPNPVRRELFFKNLKEKSKIVIYNLNGQEVFNTKTSTESINIQHLPTGSYLLQLSNPEGIYYTGRLIKIN